MNNILNSVASFTWLFDSCFFVETLDETGNPTGENYVWSNPNYSGDNTFNRTELSYNQYIEKYYPKNFYGRDKGNHFVEDYCGSDIIITGN